MGGLVFYFSYLLRAKPDPQEVRLQMRAGLVGLVFSPPTPH